MRDRATVHTRAGEVAGERLTPGEIRGTSPWGEWRATLPLNGRTLYWYPADERGYPIPEAQGPIRRVVAKLVVG